MTELRRLLSFMSAWDREAAMAGYLQQFQDSPDPEALMEELGTPTRLAIELARSYVPSPAPVREEPEPEQLPEEADLSDLGPEMPAPAEETAPEVVPEQISWDLDLTPEEPAVPVTQVVVRRGALAAYLVPAILIGLPVAVALVCLGLPFILAGGAACGLALHQLLQMLPLLPLISDVLLTCGAAVCVCALGLLLLWLGLWLSMELCWLWADKVLLALGRKLCLKEVAVQ